jgi:hypothetical protein
MLLDIMNPLEILEGAKPVLIERGPFVYRVCPYHTLSYIISIISLRRQFIDSVTGSLAVGL